ncbi:MAG: 50S ribosomal protein L25, partial [Leptospiraceae bacterium]|nr:50S ribosomal protein L25 [Leptospiraceae bacterium]
MKEKIMSKLSIKVAKRKSTGKNENNRLRVKGFIPVNIIANGKSELGSIDESEWNKIISSGIRPASVIQLDVDGGEKINAFVKEMQRFPGSGQIRHIDFYKLSPGKKITAKVSVLTTGVAKGSKMGGQFNHFIHEIKVKSSPEDMLDKLVVDVSELGVGDSVKVSDLPVPGSWEVLVKSDLVVTSVIKTKALIAAERT